MTDESFVSLLLFMYQFSFFGTDNSNGVHVSCWESGGDAKAVEGCHSCLLRDHQQERCRCGAANQTTGKAIRHYYYYSFGFCSFNV